MIDKIPIWLIWVWIKEYEGEDTIWIVELHSVDLEEWIAKCHKKALENQYCGRKDIHVEMEMREANHMYADCMHRRLCIRGVHM